MRTEADEFWAGKFGDEYTQRNQVDPGNVREFFERALTGTEDSPISTVLELGANVGHNLAFLNTWLPAMTTGVEVNVAACSQLSAVADRAYCGSIVDMPRLGLFDLVFTKGVLIHIPPEDLPAVYAAIHDHAGRWVLVAEYYSRLPREIEYRGHTGKLWARDFAGELMDTYPDLKLVDYGFVYHRDRYPQDDLSWFLMERVPLLEANPDMGVR